MELFAFGFPVMFTIVPLLMCAILLMGVFRTFKDWRHNEQSPRLTVPVTVVAKRTAYRRTMSDKRSTYANAHTNYFATFQVESGDRFELPLEGSQFGLLVEGDTGKLTFQGTRFLKFEREIPLRDKGE